MVNYRAAVAAFAVSHSPKPSADNQQAIDQRNTDTMHAEFSELEDKAYQSSTNNFSTIPPIRRQRAVLDEDGNVDHTAGAFYSSPLNHHAPGSSTALCPVAPEHAAALERSLADSARERFVLDRMERLRPWETDTMNRLWEIFISYDAGDRSISYDNYCKVRADVRKFQIEERGIDFGRIDSVFDPCGDVGLTDLLFLRSPKPASNPDNALIEIIFTEFLKTITRYKSHVELMQYDGNGDGYLNDPELEQYVEDLIRSIPTLQKITPELLPFYLSVVINRIRHLMHLRKGERVSIDKLAASKAVDELLEVQVALQPLPNSWFSCVVYKTLYNKYLGLNRSRTGLLTRKELSSYRRGIPPAVDNSIPADEGHLTGIFLDRALEFLPTFNGKLDFDGFVNFSLKVETLGQPNESSLSFFWRVFDLHEKGYLTPIIVNFFFREISQKLNGWNSSCPPLELVVLEAFDLIEPEEPLKITKSEFMASPNAGTFCGILVDTLSFFLYDNREHAVAQQQAALREQQQ